MFVPTNFCIKSIQHTMQIDVMLLKVLGKNNMKSQNEKKRDV